MLHDCYWLGTHRTSEEDEAQLLVESTSSQQIPYTQTYMIDSGDLLHIEILFAVGLCQPSQQIGKNQPGCWRLLWVRQHPLPESLALSEHANHGYLPWSHFGVACLVDSDWLDALAFG